MEQREAHSSDEAYCLNEQQGAGQLDEVQNQLEDSATESLRELPCRGERKENQDHSECCDHISYWAVPGCLILNCV